MATPSAPPAYGAAGALPLAMAVPMAAPLPSAAAPSAAYAAPSGRRVKFSAGGRVFETTTTTLDGHAYFAPIVSGAAEPDEADGCYFEDESPAVFEQLLAHLRCSRTSHVFGAAALRPAFDAGFRDFAALQRAAERMGLFELATQAAPWAFFGARPDRARLFIMEGSLLSCSTSWQVPPAVARLAAMGTTVTNVEVVEAMGQAGWEQEALSIENMRLVVTSVELTFTRPAAMRETPQEDDQAFTAPGPAAVRWASASGGGSPFNHRKTPRFACIVGNKLYVATHDGIAGYEGCAPGDEIVMISDVPAQAFCVANSPSVTSLISRVDAALKRSATIDVTMTVRRAAR